MSGTLSDNEWQQVVYRTPLVVASGIETFFQFVINTALKFLKIVWRKHNLMTSSSGGSGHPGKYSYEIPHKYL